MNPLVITGILAVTIASVATMLSFSNEQIRYSDTTEQISAIQAERLQENVQVGTGDGTLQLKNAGPIPVTIKEIRLLDDDGQIILRQSVDQQISAAQTGEISNLHPGIADHIGGMIP